ncbi:hypothetical protein [Vallitalea guaymasensis]|uniref:Chloroplast import component protein (Tic20) n=1 Tax=Vallitalea guaymasensis TaxID=1185412 RepID=A0A8J8M980_9FIRM|nr:hypothetical protein [Vallitalea guaymasensis]QUH28440.1 hypothetical protein HYG85_05685 [Vallitalea guaymasensis]
MNKTNKWVSVLAYIVFFIPILVDSNNEEYKFHTNQGLTLFLLAVAISMVGTFVPVIGWFIILPLGEIFCLVLAIMGIINAYNEKMKELPIIGKIKIIK